MIELPQSAVRDYPGGYAKWHADMSAKLTREGARAKLPVLGGGRPQDDRDYGQEPKNAKTGRISGKTRLSEHDEQALVIARAETLAPSVPALKLLHAIPNAGKRSKFTGDRMRKEGLRKGVPDLCLPAPCGGFHGLYVEMKVKGNKPSPEQLEWITALRAQGYRAEVCVGADAAWRVICEYLGLPQTLRA